MGRFSLIIAAVLLGWAGNAWPQGARATPRALTEQVVASFQALNDPKVPEAQRQTPARFAGLDQYFDYDALSAAPFKSHQKTLKAADLTKLKATFKALLIHLTHQSGQQLAHGGATISAARAKGSDCLVDFEVSGNDDDMSSTVTLTWQKRARGWQVVDVAFDGASMTKDYENQFGRILKKDGAGALDAKLKERLAQVTHSAS